MKRSNDSGKSWISDSIRVFILIAIAVVIGHWIASYTSPSLTQRVQTLEQQHKKICEYFGADCN